MEDANIDNKCKGSFYICLYIGERKLRKDNANKDFHYLCLHLDLSK